jgi:hypothetical protein
VVRDFLAVCETTYNPLLRAYKETVHKIKSHSQLSIANLDMYCLFFRIKNEQEIKKLAIMKTLNLECEELMSNKLLETVYLDERTVVAELSHRS